MRAQITTRYGVRRYLVVFEGEKENDDGWETCDVDSPDITIEDKVLEGEPGDVDDDEEGEGGDAASLGGGQGEGRVVITRDIERKKLCQ